MRDRAAYRGQNSNRLPQVRAGGSSLEVNFDSHIAGEARIRDRSVSDRRRVRHWRGGSWNGSISCLHPKRLAGAHHYNTSSLAFENKQKSPSQSVTVVRGNNPKNLMKLYPYLFRFIFRRYSEPVTEIATARELPKTQRASKRFLLVGYRSPNDQLQVIAIPRCQSDEWPRSGFPNSPL